jgi:hypothetical protein
VHPSSQPDEICAEFEGYIPASGKVRAYEQKYFCFLKARNGKIALYREYWNVLPVMNILEDLKK